MWKLSLRSEGEKVLGALRAASSLGQDIQQSPPCALQTSGVGGTLPVGETARWVALESPTPKSLLEMSPNCPRGVWQGLGALLGRCLPLGGRVAWVKRPAPQEQVGVPGGRVPRGARAERPLPPCGPRRLGLGLPQSRAGQDGVLLAGGQQDVSRLSQGLDGVGSPGCPPGRPQPSPQGHATPRGRAPAGTVSGKGTVLQGGDGEFPGTGQSLTCLGKTNLCGKVTSPREKRRK